MVATERTPLTRPNDPPNYVEYAGLLRTRRIKLRQFQCCICAALIAVFIMALVITVSYSINEMSDPLVADTTNPEEVPPPPSLKSIQTPSSSNLKIPNAITSTSLSTEEWNEAIKAGEEAIASREAADALATPLPAPSPNSRHQYAVKTSIQAGKLALAGIGELAATRSIEKSRTKSGSVSSIGAYFKNIWAPEGACKEFSKIVCPPSKYRNFDGTCNHPKNYGSSLTPFVRKLAPSYADGLETPRTGKFGNTLPSAREISLKVHPPAPTLNPSFTVMLAVFGQFLDHDITATALSQGTNGSSLTCCPAATHPECFPVEIEAGDPVYDLTGRDCMEFVRSAPAPQCKIGPRQQLNQVTSFIDGSVIYGPDLKTARNLREGENGLLRMYKTPDNRTLLPQSTDPNDGCNRETEMNRGRYCFASGDGRSNENLHLTTMHLLWARQHNRIANLLSTINPTWDDEKIYQETRRIIGAQLQHITYQEFVPIVIGEKETKIRNLKPLTSGFRFRNYSMDVNPAVANSFAAAAFRFAHTLLPGLMKITDSQKSSSSYVELHRMLFNPYSLYPKGGMESSLYSATSNSIQKTTTHVTSQLTKHLFEDPLSNATIPCGLDLVSLNIQRGRDHGLPGYTAWREYCGLGSVESFDELRGELDADALDEISKIYRYVDDVDLYTGALAEIDKSDGLIGPTFRCLVGDQFMRIQQGDRFWYELTGEPQSFTEAQLKEIRKTTLAKLICDCSEEINEIQPLVMRSISSDNPMTSCEDIPDLDLTAWKDDSFPLLKTAATDIPETWINFKDEINETVREIVDFFEKTPPAAGSQDWMIFKDWIDKSFADLRNDVASLHPKFVEGLANQSPILNTKQKNLNDFQKFSDSGFNDRTNGNEMQTGKFNYLQFVMNKSLSNLNKYSKTLTTQSTIHDDWIQFKTDVKQVLNDALMNVTGMPNDYQREELKKRISDEIEAIKNEIASMKSTKLSLIDEMAVDYSTSEWSNFKVDVTKAINDAVDRIKDQSPPPGDPAWSIFGPEIKKQFDNFKNHIPILPNTKLMAMDPTAAAYWDNFRESINKSIGNAVDDLDHEMPAAGDPAWANFGKIMKNELSGLRKNPILKSNDSSIEGSTIVDPNFAIYWKNFRDSLNKSINNAVDDLASKNLTPGDPAWTKFHTKIMNDFADLKNEFLDSKRNPVLGSKGAIDDPIVDAFWNDFKISLNKSIDKAVTEIAAKSPPPGDPAWANFGIKIMNDFADLKNKFVGFHDSSFKIMEKDSGMENFGAFDWYSFKSDVINSIVDSVENIKKNMPTPGSPAWTAFKGQIVNGFNEIPNPIAYSKVSAVGTIGKESKGEAFDWIAFKNEIDKSVAEIIDDKKISSGNPIWKDFGGKFAKFNKTFEFIKSDIDGLRPKPEESQFTVLKDDWMDFKNKINKTLIDSMNSMKFQIRKFDETGWTSFRDSIKDEFVGLKNEINFLKNENLTKNFGNLKKNFGNLKKNFESSFESKDIFEQQEKRDFNDFSSDLLSLQEKTNETLLELKKNILSLKLGATVPVISAVDWIAFKKEINDVVTRFVDAANGNQSEEWKDMKDFAKKIFADLRNRVISLREKNVDSQEKSETLNLEIKLQAKKSKDLTKNNENIENNLKFLDWEIFKSDVNSTVSSLLDDVENIATGNKISSKNLKDSLVKAQKKLVDLQISNLMTVREELPDNWAVFVNGVNKTLNSVMKKIGILKPLDDTNLVALEKYEKEVDAFFDEVKNIVEKKKIEFQNATSMGSSVSNFLHKFTTIFSMWIIFRIF